MMRNQPKQQRKMDEAGFSEEEGFDVEEFEEGGDEGEGDDEEYESDDEVYEEALEAKVQELEAKGGEDEVLEAEIAELQQVLEQEMAEMDDEYDEEYEEEYEEGEGGEEDDEYYEEEEEYYEDHEGKDTEPALYTSPAEDPFETSSQGQLASSKSEAAGMGMNFVWFAVAMLLSFIVWKLLGCYRQKKELKKQRTYRSAQADRDLGDMQMIASIDNDDERTFI